MRLFRGSPGRAQGPSDPPHSAVGPVRQLDLSADRAELDPRQNRLELDGRVVVTLDRYRLTSDSLRIQRGPRGIMVDGAGTVAFCPCPSPPITVDFRSVLMAPPTDLLLEQPTLRAFGVPVLWLPYLWLRSPKRVGILPLKIAWRGDDGLLLGSGVHLPLSAKAQLELGAAGYVRGGAEIEGRLVTPRTTSAVRWDYLRNGSVAADLRGAVSPDGEASVAWSVDALRGARALTGPAMLEEVALRQDRARAVAGWSSGAATLGISLSADSARGGPVSSVDTLGPGLHAGFGSALGKVGAVDADVGVATLRRSGSATVTLVSQHAEVRGDARVGPVSLGVEARTRATATLDEHATGYAVASGLTAALSVPLVKELGTADLPAQHWLAPIVTGTVGGADTRAPSVVPPLAADGAFYVASGGIRSTLGELAFARRAASVSVEGAYLGAQGGPARPAIVTRAGGRADFLSLRAEGLAIAGADRAGVLLSELRVGREEGPFIGGRAEGSVGAPPLLARLLTGGWSAPWVPWLGLPGWSIGGRAGVPWTRWLASSVDADYDVTSRTLLGLRGTLSYRHPCGCLGVTLWGGHRAGRRGVDSWLTVDLFP